MWEGGGGGGVWGEWATIFFFFLVSSVFLRAIPFQYIPVHFEAMILVVQTLGYKLSTIVADCKCLFPSSISMVALKRKLANLDKTFEVVVLCCNIFIGDKHVLKNRLYSYDNTWSWGQVFGSFSVNNILFNILYIRAYSKTILL